jgi:hypothetical protein
MTHPTTIALTGPGPRTEIADYLAAIYGYKILPLASPVRAMLERLLLAYGYGTSEVNSRLGALQNAPLDLVPGQPTPRYLLNTLRDDWGRGTIHRDLWADAWCHMAAGYPGVVVDDLETASERAILHTRENTAIWLVLAPGIGAPEGLGFVPDAVVPGIRDRDALRRAVEAALQ